MEYKRSCVSEMETIWELQKLYKAEIGEEPADEAAKMRLAEAIRAGRILFYGAYKDDKMVGCCSITVGFSTFNYLSSGVFEDFYIRPEYRHKGIARKLVRFAYDDSGVKSLTVGCAPCDEPMYASLGFSIPLGKLLALDE